MLHGYVALTRTSVTQRTSCPAAFSLAADRRWKGTPLLRAGGHEHARHAVGHRWHGDQADGRAHRDGGRLLHRHLSSQRAGTHDSRHGRRPRRHRLPAAPQSQSGAWRGSVAPYGCSTRQGLISHAAPLIFERYSVRSHSPVLLEPTDHRWQHLTVHRWNVFPNGRFQTAPPVCGRGKRRWIMGVPRERRDLGGCRSRARRARRSQIALLSRHNEGAAELRCRSLL